MNSTTARLIPITFGILVAVTISEVSLRLFSTTTGDAPKKDTTSSPGLMRQDELTEWYPREGQTHERTAPDGQPFQLHINATGQRGDAVGERAPGELRVLFLGDSFTMAHNRPEDDTFVGRTAALLEQKLPFPTRCINGGVNGFSTCQELAYYRYFASKLQPDVVVLCFFLGNDFRDNMIGTRQARSMNPVLFPTSEQFATRHQEPFLRRGDTALRDPISGDLILRPHARWLEVIERNSFLARLLGSRCASLLGKWTGDISQLDRQSRYYFYEIGLFQQRSDGLFQTAVELTHEAVRQLHRTVVEDGAELVMVLLPSQHQVDEERWQRTLAELGVAESALGSLDKRYPNRLMVDFCASRGIPVLDLHERFAGAPDPSRLYTAAIDDRHFSAAGQALVGRAIAEFLALRLSGPFHEATQSYRAGLRSTDRNRLAAAERALLSALPLRPKWAAPYVALGELYTRSGAPQKAAHHFGEAIARNPDSAQAHEGFAEVCVAGGDLDAGLEAYLQALELRPGWWPYLERLQQIHELRGETEAAAQHRIAVEEVFAASARVRRFWWSEHYAAGAAFAARRKWMEAEREFVRASTFLPDDPVSHYNLASFYEHVSRPEAAATAYRKALEVAPDFAPARERLHNMRTE